MKQKMDVTNTVRNEFRGMYNCGGYALNTFDWYCPRGIVFFARSDDSAVQHYANSMIKEFDGKLRIIQDVKELMDDEYAVAFRTREGDFHFCKRDDSGNWRHKRGGTPKLHRITKERLFSEEWPGGYHSQIVLFAMKK